MLTHGQVVRLIFGLKLRELRQERSLSPAELARVRDVSVSYPNEIEKGKKYPKADKILSLSQALGVRYDQLTSRELPRRLEPLGESVNSKILNKFPLKMHGLAPAPIIELIANAPAKVNAFISTIFEIARNHEMRQEQLFLAALRSYQEMHGNCFGALEQDVRAFVGSHQLATAAPFDLRQLEQALTMEYGYTLDQETLGQHAVATQARLRSVFRPKARRLLLRPRLRRGQQACVLGRGAAFNYLKLAERPFVSSTQLGSFEEVLSSFKASYLAGALPMEEESPLRDLKRVFGAKKWHPDRLLDWLTEYDVSPEMFMQRLTTLLPRHFGPQSLFFLRIDQAADAPYELTKELHLARPHNPHRNELNEHYCRRRASLRLEAEARALPVPDTAAAPVTVVGAQRSRYFGPDDEYRCFAQARVDTPAQGLSVTVGLRCDDHLRAQVRFLADPARPGRLVNETCARCPIPDCESRAAAPIEVERQAGRQALEAVVAALVQGV